jgi:hypothetical protein
MISPVEVAYRSARCTNVAACPRAAAGETVAWYTGAGEYCPDCGEALIAGDPESAIQPIGASELAVKSPATVSSPARTVRGDVRTPLTAVDRLSVPPTARESGFVSSFPGFESARRRSLRIMPSSPYRTGIL